MQCQALNKRKSSNTSKYNILKVNTFFLRADFILENSYKLEKSYPLEEDTKKCSFESYCILQSVFQQKQALRNSCELLRQRKELHTSSWNMQVNETACKLIKLNASLHNCMKAFVTACKLMWLHLSSQICMHSGTFWNILHAFWKILEHFACILEYSAYILIHSACIRELSACILEHSRIFWSILRQNFNFAGRQTDGHTHRH